MVRARDLIVDLPGKRVSESRGHGGGGRSQGKGSTPKVRVAQQQQIAESPGMDVEEKEGRATAKGPVSLESTFEGSSGVSDDENVGSVVAAKVDDLAVKEETDVDEDQEQVWEFKAKYDEEDITFPVMAPAYESYKGVDAGMLQKRDEAWAMLHRAARCGRKLISDISEVGEWDHTLTAKQKALLVENGPARFICIRCCENPFDSRSKFVTSLDVFTRHLITCHREPDGRFELPKMAVINRKEPRSIMVPGNYGVSGMAELLPNSRVQRLAMEEFRKKLRWDDGEVFKNLCKRKLSPGSEETPGSSKKPKRPTIGDDALIDACRSGRVPRLGGGGGSPTDWKRPPIAAHQLLLSDGGGGEDSLASPSADLERQVKQLKQLLSMPKSLRVAQQLISDGMGVDVHQGGAATHLSNSPMSQEYWTVASAVAHLYEDEGRTFEEHSLSEGLTPGQCAAVGCLVGAALLAPSGSYDASHVLSANFAKAIELAVATVQYEGRLHAPMGTLQIAASRSRSTSKSGLPLGSLSLCGEAASPRLGPTAADSTASPLAASTNSPGPRSIIGAARTTGGLPASPSPGSNSVPPATATRDPDSNPQHAARQMSSSSRLPSVVFSREAPEKSPKAATATNGSSSSMLANSPSAAVATVSPRAAPPSNRSSISGGPPMPVVEKVPVSRSMTETPPVEPAVSRADQK